MATQQPNSRLVHYTSSVDVIVSILHTGFVLIPNKRYLINALVGEELYASREPQAFGMVSFTERSLHAAEDHRERFGRYGIIVDWDWAAANDAQSVIYLDEAGPLFATYSWLFRLGRQELLRATGGKPSFQTLHNKAMASVNRAELYAQLLTLYEYMEPERSSTQAEWRIVSPVPLHHDTDDRPREEMVRSRIEAAKKWNGSLGAVKVTPDDVVGFVCPRRERAVFVAALPAEYRGWPVVTYRDAPQMNRYARVHERALASHRLREKVTVSTEPPPPETIYVRKVGRTYQLPTVREFEGAMISENEVITNVHARITYRTPTGIVCELTMPLRAATFLMHLIRQFRTRLGLEPDSGGRAAG